MTELKNKGFESVHLLSDSCGGQNRNRPMVLANWVAAQTLGFQEISHTFFVRGHSENEADTIHSLVEKNSKHMRIFTTSQWAFAISTAKIEKPQLEVTEMVTENFKDFKAATKNIINMDVDTNKDNVRYTDIRRYSVKKDDPCINIQYSMHGEPVKMNLFEKGRKHAQFEVPTVKGAYQKPLPINIDKRSDLLWMCDEGIIPAAHRDFYESLNATLRPDLPVSDYEDSEDDS